MDGNISTALSRRHFIVTGLTATGGLAVGWSAVPRLAEAMTVGPQPWDDDGVAPNELDAWIAINPDDSVLIRYQRSEMGQGSMTALAMCVAEELECDWSKVRTEYASPNRSVREHDVYGNQASVGSQTVRQSHELMQHIGANARERLIAAAAQRWNVAASECAAANSVVTHQPSGKTLRYGELVNDAAKITLAKDAPIKTPEQYSLIGKPMPRVDVPVKLNGSAKYGIDTRVPGMVYAAIAACPVPGGTLKSVDDSPVAGARGIIKVVKLPNAVAVVADNYWRAKQALARLQPEWETGAAGKTDSAQMNRDYRDALDGPGAVARNDGDTAKAMAGAAKIVEAAYEVPYLAHATMEPLNATAHWQADRLDLWVGTQMANVTLKVLAGVTRLKPEQVYVHNAFLGGGFGRRGGIDEGIQAAMVSKAVGKPVKLIWSREEDMRHDRYRPQAAIRLKAGLAADGTPVALQIKTAVGSLLRSNGISKVENGIEPMAVEGLANNPYMIANQHVECILKNTHIPVSFWRSVGSSQNAYFIESFIDEMALAAGKDPVDFRRALLQDRKDWLGVLDTLVEHSKWGSPMAAGKGRGIAIHECFGSVVGAVAEIDVNPRGDVKVERVVYAYDCGHAVNPLTIAEQMEGGTIFGLSAALWGKMTVKDGAIEQGNFDTYRMVRLAEAPKIEVYPALSGGGKWGGVGEPGTAPIAPAVANAIFAVTGKRLRSLPIMDHDLSGTRTASAESSTKAN
jgi:isoquinoline 1-oxidoreductase subunit beta